jgi:hypothetical protein
MDAPEKDHDGHVARLSVMPDECLAHIAGFLERPRDLMAMALSCGRLAFVASEDAAWRRAAEALLGPPPEGVTPETVRRVMRPPWRQLVRHIAHTAIVLSVGARSDRVLLPKERRVVFEALGRVIARRDLVAVACALYDLDPSTCDAWLVHAGKFVAPDVDALVHMNPNDHAHVRLAHRRNVDNTTDEGVPPKEGEACWWIRAWWSVALAPHRPLIFVAVHVRSCSNRMIMTAK